MTPESCQLKNHAQYFVLDKILSFLIRAPLFWKNMIQLIRPMPGLSLHVGHIFLEHGEVTNRLASFQRKDDKWPHGCDVLHPRHIVVSSNVGMLANCWPQQSQCFGGQFRPLVCQLCCEIL